MSAVPAMQWSGSRTRPSFSNAQTATYLPGGTPSSWKAPVMFGATQGPGARRFGGSTPRPVAASYVDSTNSTLDDAVPEPGSTIWTEPVAAPGMSVASARSSATSLLLTSVSAGV